MRPPTDTILLVLLLCSAIKKPAWAVRQPGELARLWEVTERQLAAAEAAAEKPMNGFAKQQRSAADAAADVLIPAKGTNGTKH